MLFIGIDYGHGETAVGYYDDSNILDPTRIGNLDITNGKKVLYSAIVQKEGDKNKSKYLIGDETVMDNLSDATDYCVCFKGDVSSKEFSKRHKILLGHFMNRVYINICNNNSRINCEGNYKVYIACPTEWHKTKSIVESYKQHAIDYDVPVEAVFMESAAAYYRMREKKIEGGIAIGEYKGVVVIDFGSSTIDFTYFNQINTPINKGYHFGASRVEDIVLEYALTNEPTGEYANNFIKRFEDKGKDYLRLKCRKSKEVFFSNKKENRFFLIDIDLGEPSGNDPEFKDKKLENQTGIYSNDFIIKLLKEKKYLSELQKILEDFKKEIDQNEIHYVYLTGGASNMDFFVEMVCDVYKVKFGISCTKDQDPSTTISQGIARLGEATWRWQLEEKKLREKVENWKKEKVATDISNYNNLYSNQCTTGTCSLSQFVKNECRMAFLEKINERITEVLEKYKNGEVGSSGCRSIEALKNELDLEFNKDIFVSEKDMTTISEKVNEMFMNEIGEEINNRIAEIWNVNYNTSNININITSPVCLNETNKEKIKNKINEIVIKSLRDFYLIFINTSKTQTKDRDDLDRNKIFEKVSEQVKTENVFNISFEFDYPAVIDQVNQSINNYLDRAISFAKLDTLNE